MKISVSFLSLFVLLFSFNSSGICSNAPGKPNGLGVAKCEMILGVVLAKAKGSNTWTTMKKGQGVGDGSTVIAVPKAEFKSPNGKVQVDLICDVSQRGPFPVLEPAVTFKAPSGSDISLQLDRGIILITNLNKEGKAKVQLQITEKVVDITLLEPGTKVVIELFGRHPPGGQMFSTKPGEEGKVLEDPTLNLVLLVVEGKITINNGVRTVSMNAPPGPARIQMDSITGFTGVEDLQKLPEAIRPPTAEELLKAKVIANNLKILEKLPVQEALTKMIASDNVFSRKLGVILSGATDNLENLTAALSNKKDSEIRNAAVVGLRHWMGRKKGQTQALYNFLASKKEYPPILARTILQLLDGFTDEDRRNADTFHLLLAYMDNDQLPIREIAWWHLQRLSHAATAGNYDPTASHQERQKAIAAIQKALDEKKKST